MADLLHTQEPERSVYAAEATRAERAFLQPEGCVPKCRIMGSAAFTPLQRSH